MTSWAIERPTASELRAEEIELTHGTVHRRRHIDWKRLLGKRGAPGHTNSSMTGGRGLRLLCRTARLSAVGADSCFALEAGVFTEAREVLAMDDTQSSAPVLTFHLLSGRASVSSHYARAYSEGSGGEGVAWVGVGLREELVGVVARQHKLPIGAHRVELERRSSMDIRQPQWCTGVVTLDNISWPTPGPNVDASIGSTMRSRRGLRAKSTCK